MTAAERKRVVIITGASRGLGKEIALRFGMAGDRVVVNYQSHEQGAGDVAAEIRRAGGDAALFRADVRNAVDVDEMVNDTVKRWGSVDVLVNNAGVKKDGLILRMMEQDWDEIIGANLTGPFNCIRAVAKIMSKQKNGHIISVSSIVGMHGREGQANYASSKAGVIGLTKACAKELGRFNIKVNSVLPGYLVTGMGQTVSGAARDRILRENALCRASTPNEVADFIYHLSLMENVSGQVFNLDSRIV